MATNAPPESINTDELIGIDTITRPFESWYAFVCRLIRANLLTDAEIREQLPVPWVRWAFAPYDITEAELDLPERLRNSAIEPESKFLPSAWDPFPDLSNAPPEWLRICPRCIQSGTHSYALQGDALARCPVHDEPLVNRCPHCETPLLWKTRSAGSSAFCCPAGCALSTGTHSGLHVADELALTSAWSTQLSWLRALKGAISFVSGPIHVAYPPYLALAALRVPPLPSKGLLPALLVILRSAGVNVPEGAAHHAQDCGSWELQLRPWPGIDSACKASAASMEALRLAFRRGAYHTEIPIVQGSAIATWLSDSEKEHGHWTEGGVEERSQGPVLKLASYLLTNNELTALRRLLARSTDDPATACAHYDAVLAETLEHARRRRMALNHLDVASDELRVAETFDAIVRTPERTWRVVGRTKGEEAAQATWKDLRELAEMGGGTIYVTARHGPI